MAHTMTAPPVPWYRQLWPWLLMLMPACAVVGGVITFWLAATTNNSLVVDDYYREGRAINMQLARDEAAASMGLSGSLSRQADAAVLQLHSTAGAALPPFVTVRGRIGGSAVTAAAVNALARSEIPRAPKRG